MGSGKGPLFEIGERNIRFLERDQVYPAREDTFIMLRHLERIAPRKGGRFLEMGCGTGVLSVHAALSGWKVHAADRNPLALVQTRENMVLNGVSGRLFLSDLFRGIPQNEECEYDLIVFNPPYLDRGEDLTPAMRLALYGGGSGAERTLEFLAGAVDRIKERGSLIILVTSSTRSAVIELASVLGLRKMGEWREEGSGEGLYVLELVR